jgi:hypothetical protein
MALGNIHGSGTILGSITLAIMAVGQALAAVTLQSTRQDFDMLPKVDEVEHRNTREDARTQNVWLFGD